MKNQKILLTVFTFFLAVMIGNASLFADSQTDNMPLGPSKYKLLIDKIEQDQIMRTDSGEQIKLEDLVAQYENTDVFIIGEAHDNYDCHTFQRDFIEALFKKYPKIIVGFEFFWRQDNELLEKWRTGKIEEMDFVKQVGWYERGNQNYGYTRLIMDMIKKYKIKTIGLNIPRKIVRKISRGGYDTLSAEEKALFPTIDIPNPEHEYFIKSVFGLMAVQVPMWFTNIYAAQKAWDVIMAESMIEFLKKEEFKGYKGIIIAGNNHVAYKLGIPFRYGKADENARITTISPILLPSEKKDEDGEDEGGHPMMSAMSKYMKPASLFSRGIADFVFAARQPEYHHFPVIGFSVKMKDEKLMVTRVTKDSIAKEHGLAKGDQVTSVDGITITTLEQFRTIVAQKGWGDSFNLGVIKKIELKKEEEEKEEKKEEKQEAKKKEMKKKKKKSKKK
jgi:uncharacterized iron-regulated protein